MMCLVVAFFAMLWVATAIGAYSYGWWWRGKFEREKNS